MDFSLRPSLIALFFCERAVLEYHKSKTVVSDSLVLWCFYRVALLDYFLTDACFSFRCPIERFHFADENRDSSSERPFFSTFKVCSEDDGREVLMDFLSYTFKIGGKRLYHYFLVSLIDFLNFVCSEECRSVSIHIISETVMARSQSMEELKGCANLLTRFRMWVYRVWKLASFDNQLALVSVIPLWLRFLVSLKNESDVVQQDHRLVLEPCTNVKKMHDSLQGVFEGRVRGDRASHTSHNLVNGVLDGNSNLPGILAVSSEHSSTTNFLENATGPQSVMTNIACGMLLYQNSYLQLRSMQNARCCAENAVLIEHQFYRAEIIALSHLGCFQVYFCSANPEKAADSLAMGLQLLRQKREDVKGYMVSIFYLSASQLFLFFFSAISSSLRLALHSEKRAVEDSVPSQKERCRRGPVAAETVAQTVLHALFISETQSLYHPLPGALWKEALLSLMRSTTLVQSSIYGISTIPLALTESTIRLLLSEVVTAAPVTFMSCIELTTVFPELTRHVAHTALAVQEGTVVVKESPLIVLQNYLESVEKIFGTENVRKVECNFFFHGVSMYIVACWLSQHGFMMAAYESLEHLLLEIHFQCRREFSVALPLSSHETNHTERSDGLNTHFWSPEILLLYVYVQKKRAELSCYLGYIDVLWELKEQTNSVASGCHFAYGVLISQYMEILYFQKTNQCSLAIERSFALHATAKKVGFNPLTKLALAQIVSGFIQQGKYFMALYWLDELDPVPTNLLMWYFSNRLTVLSECVFQQQCSSEFISSIVIDALLVLDFEKYSGIPPSINFCRNFPFFSLMDMISIVHSLNRLASSVDYELYLEFDFIRIFNDYVLILQKRHAIRGIFTCSFFLLDVIKKSTSGELLKTYR